ncbi:MAG: hypothetical protein SNI45_02405 [Rikenellaceae bacterium]
MKKINLFILTALAVVATSCGATKPVAKPMAVGDEVIMYAEAEPDRRAYGVGTHFEQATAKRTADANARAALAAAIQTMVMQSFDSFASSVSATSSENGVAGMLVQDQVSTLNDAVTAISKECVTNTAVVKMERDNSNGQWTVYVCMEHRLAVADMVKQISEKITQSVPDEIKESIKFDQYLHQKKMEEAFESYTSVSK